MLTKLGQQFKKIHSEVQHQLGFAGSESSLRRILKDMGYKYRKRQLRDIVKERPDAVAKCHTYIASMKKLRETGRKIIHLDET